MKTVTLEVDDLLSILDFAAVEKRLTDFAGVQEVAINAGSSSASVTFDELITSRGRLVERGRSHARRHGARYGSWWRHEHG